MAPRRFTAFPLAVSVLATLFLLLAFGQTAQAGRPCAETTPRTERDAKGCTAFMADVDNCNDMDVDAKVRETACTRLLEVHTPIGDALYGTHYLRAKARYDLGQYKAAVNDFSFYLKAHPDDAEVIYDRGRAKQRNKNYDDAIADFTEAIRLDPGAYFPYRRRGDIYLNLGNLDNALQDYNKALEIRPDSHYALYGRGVTLLRTGAPTKALDDLNKAIAHRTDSSQYYAIRGLAHFVAQQFQEAAADYRRS